MLERDVGAVIEFGTHVLTLLPDADVDVAIAHERAVSRSLGGRTVFDDMKSRGQWHRASPSQLELVPSR